MPHFWYFHGNFEAKIFPHKISCIPWFCRMRWDFARFCEVGPPPQIEITILLNFIYVYHRKISPDKLSMENSSGQIPLKTYFLTSTSTAAICERRFTFYSSRISSNWWWSNVPFGLRKPLPWQVWSHTVFPNNFFFQSQNEDKMFLSLQVEHIPLDLRLKYTNFWGIYPTWKWGDWTLDFRLKYNNFMWKIIWSFIWRMSRRILSIEIIRSLVKLYQCKHSPFIVMSSSTVTSFCNSIILECQHGYPYLNCPLKPPLEPLSQRDK